MIKKYIAWANICSTELYNKNWEYWQWNLWRLSFLIEIDIHQLASLTHSVFYTTICKHDFTWYTAPESRRFFTNFSQANKELMRYLLSGLDRILGGGIFQKNNFKLLSSEYPTFYKEKRVLMVQSTCNSEESL